MPRQFTIAAAGLAAALSGSQAANAALESCEAFRITADGRELRMSAAEIARLREQGISVSASGAGLSSRAEARGSGSVSSSSSASASSSSRGGGTTVSRVTDGDGRTITLTQDGRGCRIIVDER